MDYEFFYDLAKYASGNFDDKQVACYAHSLWLSWQQCCHNKKLNYDMFEVIQNLENDPENEFLGKIKLTMRRW